MFGVLGEIAPPTEKSYSFESSSSTLVPCLLPVAPNSCLRATVATPLINHFDWWANQKRVVNGFKPLILSGLSALLHVKYDFQQIRSPTDSMTLKVMSSASAMDHIIIWTGRSLIVMVPHATG